MRIRRLLNVQILILIISIMLSIAAIMLSVKIYGVNFNDYWGFVLGTLTLLVTILIGWNIVSVIGIDKRMSDFEKKMIGIVNSETKKLESKLCEDNESAKVMLKRNIIKQSYLVENEIIKSFLFNCDYNMCFEIGGKMVADSSEMNSEDALDNISEILILVINKVNKEQEKSRIAKKIVDDFIEKLKNSKVSTSKSTELLLLIGKEYDSFVDSN